MSTPKKEMPVSEWSYPVEAATITGRNHVFTIAPDEQARKRLEKRLGLVSLEALEAKIEFSRNKGSRIIHAKGHVSARVVQTCVATLEPVEESIDQDFEAWYADPEQAVSFVKAKYDKKLEKGHTEAPILEENEDPEPIIDGKIDAGDLAVQYLSLALNPFPQKEGASEVIEKLEKSTQSDVYNNPFAALKNWKAKYEKGDS